MPNWKARAASVIPPVPEEILDQVIPTLESLDAAFRPLVEKIRPDELAWNAPEAE